MLGKKILKFNLSVMTQIFSTSIPRSFSDPRDIQGLAHFLEHMIFMGSKKFPSENEFDQYIKRCAGFDNADTDFEETSFYFEVSENYLDGALDRFANLFKEPLMLKECMTREREAVESEFRSKMQKEDVRRDQLLSSLGNPDHPCSIFTWGNLKTLKDKLSDDELHRRVHEFQKRHYSAHRMFMCIQARLPLDTMQVKRLSISKVFSFNFHFGSHVRIWWLNTFVMFPAMSCQETTSVNGII